jgi:hypothetical protein
VTLDERLASLRLAAPSLEVRPVDEALRERPDRARLAFNGTTTVKFAYLDAPEQRGLPLRLYPADTLQQARVFYGSPACVRQTLALSRRGWELEPKFHFGYRERGLCWSGSSLPVDDYVAYWTKRIDQTGAIGRGDWKRELEQLIADGVFDPEDRAQFDADFTNTRRKYASPRPAIELARFWAPGEAGLPGFPEQLRSVLAQALDALGEQSTMLGAPA